MTLYQRIRESYAAHGLTSSLAKLYSILLDHWIDLRYGLDICPASELRDLTIKTGNIASGHHYAPVRLLALRKLFNSIDGDLPSHDVLVDIGSGKGRVLLAAAERGFREARGIEFASELCKIAVENCSRYKSATDVSTVFKTTEIDAAEYAFQPDESIFIFCNPFEGDVVARVLQNIANSVRICPRRIMMIYYNPKCRSVIEQHGSFAFHKEVTWCGHLFVVYANRQQS